MSDRPVSNDVHREIEQFLFREARTLDKENLREWLETMLDPEIRYQMVMHEERFRKDKSPESAKQIMPFDENHANLDMRIRQFESGLQTMQDPAQRMFRVISNIEAYHHENDGLFMVYSYCTLNRFRRLYERELQLFARTDVLKKSDSGEYRLLSRRIDLGERVVRNKNLLFFV